MNHSTKTTTVSINDSGIPEKLKTKYQKDYDNEKKIIISIISVPLIIFLVFFIIPKLTLGQILLIIGIILILGVGFLFICALVLKFIWDKIFPNNKIDLF